MTSTSGPARLPRRLARLPRVLHTLTAVVATAALVLQLVLVLTGAAVLDEASAPPLGLALLRFVAYFTIQSNVLVAVASWTLVRDPARDGLRWWRGLRLAGLVGITVTGVVHFLLLRPLLHLQGASWLADKALHVAVPVLALLAFVAVGPRPRVDRRAVGVAVGWAVAWLVVTLTYGRLTGWVPYPFLDVDENGWGGVAVVCAGITVFFLALCALAALVDRRLRPRP
ncbi:Pr6Pr family membrane protein [Nocardioides sp. GY 10127]|uniref:Pr6Pr family membrane protein n=1 Tax=Nocardioides sp. GY 10127 TaxID=2569762 RepID=UPI0010A8917B|nr:Pr6Pr family membrane protein [Nocardioides sp. GY 10127]TIC80777.1 hypothetical protein E8D37_12995 [Nocardioides sp. GY 10127]